MDVPVEEEEENRKKTPFLASFGKLFLNIAFPIKDPSEARQGRGNCGLNGVQKKL
jgi:hypothetical protein